MDLIILKVAIREKKKIYYSYKNLIANTVTIQ